MKLGKYLDGRSDRHVHAQERIRSILGSYGFHAELEYPYPCAVDGFPEEKEFRADVRAIGYGDFHVPREICVEIDGPKGHTTKQAYNSDQNKYRSIREKYGEHIEWYPFTFKQCSRWTDGEIAAQMYVGSDYRARETILAQVLTILSEKGPQPISRVRSEAMLTSHQWKIITKYLLEHKLMKETKGLDKRTLRNAQITPKGIKYMRQLTELNEMLKNIRTDTDNRRTKRR